mgnify:CR=1 FL=1
MRVSNECGARKNVSLPRVAREYKYIVKIITFTKLLFNISTLKQNVSSKANI